MTPANRRAVEYGTDVVTPDDEAGREPIDPVYASLFRPEDLEPEVEPEAEAQPEAEPASEPEPEPELDAELPLPVPVATTSVDTGRLFRSQGVTGNEVAVLALDHNGRLRTLTRTDDDPSLPVRVNSAVTATGTGLVVDEVVVPEDGEVTDSRGDRRRHRATRAIEPSSPGISAGAVYLIVIGVTVIVGMINAWLGDGELGFPTGLALLVSSVYCALRVRREDDVVAIIIPPIAFFLAAITAGQLFRGATGGGLLNRAQLVFFTMSYNWYWVIGTTVIVVVIVLVRRRK